MNVDWDRRAQTYVHMYTHARTHAHTVYLLVYIIYTVHNDAEYGRTCDTIVNKVIKRKACARSLSAPFFVRTATDTP